MAQQIFGWAVIIGTVWLMVRRGNWFIQMLQPTRRPDHERERVIW